MQLLLKFVFCFFWFVTWKRLLIVIFLLSVLNNAFAMHQKEPVCQSLAGNHVFASGDDPSWSELEFDDSDWGLVRVPGDLSSQAIQKQFGIGWYRIRFYAEPFLRGHPLALHLGNVGNADEAYLNGVRIGGEGIIDDKFVEAPWKSRIYPVPDDLIRFERENVLAVRILDTYRMAGIFQGPICIGSKSELLLNNIDLQFERKASEIFLATLMTFFLALCIFVVLHKPYNQDVASFSVFLAVFLSMFVLESIYFYEYGLKTPLVQRTINALACTLPAAGLWFFVVFMQFDRNWLVRALIGLNMGLAALMLVPMSLDSYYLFFNLAGGLIGLTACVALTVTLFGVRRRNPDAWILLLGGLGFALGLLLDFIPFGDHLHGLSVQPADLGMIFLVLIMAYAMAVRFARSQRQVRTLSARILHSHEQERRRIARNLHDSLGQFLSTLKLRLQMMEARLNSGNKVSGDEICNLTNDTSLASVQLRDICTDLRPEYLVQLQLLEVLRWHARNVTRQSGLEVRVIASENWQKMNDLPVCLKDNLYRICQEAINNTVKHAAASSVNIELYQKRNLIVLIIADNGRGFDLVRAKQGEGLGMHTMQERAELLGGRFSLASAPGHGCRIQVEVPIP